MALGLATVQLVFVIAVLAVAVVAVVAVVVAVVAVVVVVGVAIGELIGSSQLAEADETVERTISSAAQSKPVDLRSCFEPAALVASGCHAVAIAAAAAVAVSPGSAKPPNSG